MVPIKGQKNIPLDKKKRCYFSNKNKAAIFFTIVTRRISAVWRPSRVLMLTGKVRGVGPDTHKRRAGMGNSFLCVRLIVVMCLSVCETCQRVCG